MLVYVRVCVCVFVFIYSNACNRISNVVTPWYQLISVAVHLINFCNNQATADYCPIARARWPAAQKANSFVERSQWLLFFCLKENNKNVWKIG